MTRHTIFVSRKYPPSRGGMESAAVNLWSALSQIRSARLVKFGLANRWLPVVLPMLFVRTLWNSRGGRTDAILLQDGVLAPWGVVLGRLTGRPVAVIVHGLEVTHTGGLHRRLMNWSLPKLDRIIAVSNNTARLVLEQYPRANVTVINNGVNDEFFVPANAEREGAESADAALERITGVPAARLRSARILVTVGRLVPRKGVRWFVEGVLPLLAEPADTDTDTDYLYLVVGGGGERTAIEAATRATGQQANVALLGSIPTADLLTIYNRADVFVMPNVPVTGDVEGFGIVALEASSAGTPVVAADIDGISDAVRSPGNGRLVPAEDSTAFARAIRETDSSPRGRASVRQFTLDTFSWPSRAEDVSALLDEMVSAKPVRGAR
jgi:glycosyltransferase involved in cell wall biosynthesis